MRARKNTVYRVLQGGSYFNRVRHLRVIDRNGWDEPEGRSRGSGFRFVVRGKK